MSYSDIYAAANDATFQGRCSVAAWNAAQAIVSESPDTANHQSRKDWATRVLQDRANITPLQLAMQVLRNSVIAGAPSTASDNDIQFQVDSVLADLITIG